LKRYYKRKSQRKSKLYNREAFKELVNRYGLIDLTKYVPDWQPVKAWDENCRKAVCGKIACTVWRGEQMISIVS